MPYSQLLSDAREAIEAGVQAVHPDRLMDAASASDRVDGDTRTTIHEAKQIYAATIGKAAAPWARQWGNQISADAGCVVAPKGYSTAPKPALPQPWQQVDAGHPHPTEDSARAGRLLLDMAAKCGRGDLLIVGLSGGGSACTALPPAGISMAAVRMLNEQLLQSGLPIDAVNAVRKHVLQVGGGRLAAAAYPAAVRCYVISDVPDDDLSTIASGPTVGDPTTYADGIHALREAHLWSDIPDAVRTYLVEGKGGTHPETVPPGDKRLSRAQTTVIASNDDARTAAVAYLRKRGYTTVNVNKRIEGEASEVGARHARRLTESRGPCAFVWGGEPTVHVTGTGVGGRSQEAALAAVPILGASDVAAVLFCAGTDGIDGPTDAAGAWATPETHEKAQACGLAPEAYLANNDSYTFFKRLGGLYQPGPTETNVMDLHVGLVGAAQMGRAAQVEPHN
ncbi:MAG: DUF4147 domain-containing protein [Longimonas sp.]|uniref:glycerate kinase type-2 family protein n=1 Tax=Longimonas sp. TaxID=2039626 RepID=UPI00336072A3